MSEVTLTSDQLGKLVDLSAAIEFLVYSGYTFSEGDLHGLSEIFGRYRAIGLDAEPLLRTLLERIEEKWQADQRFPCAFLQGFEQMLWWQASEPCSIAGYVDKVTEKFVDAIDGVDAEDEYEPSCPTSSFGCQGECNSRVQAHAWTYVPCVGCPECTGSSDRVVA